MKLFFQVLLLLLLCNRTVAQVKTPSSSDLNSMMEKMMLQNGASKEEVEAAKKMMQQNMGNYKVPSVNVPKPILQKVPSKDLGRIAVAKKITLKTDDNLKDFILELQNAISLKFPASVSQMGKELLATFPKNYQNSEGYNWAATGCWMSGYPQLGLWIMGEAAKSNPQNSNVLNNYAAMLTMCGVEQYAIPILNRINAQFPNNYSILNNMGQAWFGLGDLSTAEKYLDSSIRRFPACSQAIHTKAEIVESRGEKEKSSELLEQCLSIGFSSDIIDELAKKGKNFKNLNWKWESNKPQDPLGLNKFILPPIPKNIAQSIEYKPLWDDFSDNLNDISSKLTDEINNAAEEQALLMEKRAQNAGKPMSYETANSLQLLVPFAVKAKKFTDAIDLVAHNKPIFGSNIYTERMNELFGKHETDGKDLDAKKAAAKASCPIVEHGEDKDVEPSCYCPKFDQLTNEYLAKENGLLEEFITEVVEANRIYTNEKAYYLQYQMGDVDFKVQRLQLQLAYIGLLGSLRPAFATYSCKEPEFKESQSHGLLDFDSLKCTTKSEFIVPGIGSISIACNQMTTEIAPVFSHLKFKYTENWWTGQISNASIGVNMDVGKIGTLDVGVSGNFDKNGFTNGEIKIEGEVGLVGTKKGPVEMGVYGNSAVTLTFDSKGNSDVKVTTDIKAGATIQTEGGKDGVVLAPGEKLTGSIGINAGPKISNETSLGGLNLIKF